MLDAKLLAAGGSDNLVFVGGVAGGATSNATTGDISFSLTGLTGGTDSAPAAGDLVIICVAFKDPSNRNISSVSAGYTELTDLYANSSNDTNFAAYYKVLSTAETSISINVGVTGFNVAARLVMHAWRKINATSPLDTTPTTATGTPTGGPDAPAITTVTGEAVVVAVGATAFSSTYPSTALTAPSGMENFFTAASSAVTIGIASALVPSAGVYNPPAFGGGSSFSQNSYAAITIALRPQ